MAKKNPQLRLIQQPGQFDISDEHPSPEEAFNIVTVKELSSAERSHVERVLSKICPGAGLIGVAKTPRSWDLRPVVLLPNENSPSVIRFVGPEVALSQTISSRMRDLFKHFDSYKDLRALLRDHGELEGQIWFRREFVDYTLEDLLRVDKPLEISRAFEISNNLLKAVGNWHARGLAHGHITAANVGLVGMAGTGPVKDDLTLIDFGVGVSCVQACASVGLEDFPRGYLLQTFAPETISGESVLFSADVYGLGRVLHQIFSRVACKPEELDRFNKNKNFFRSMSGSDPEKRPNLSRVSAMVSSSLLPPKKEKATSKNKKQSRKQSVPLKPGEKRNSSGNQAVATGKVRSKPGKNNVAPEQGSASVQTARVKEERKRGTSLMIGSRGGVTTGPSKAAAEALGYTKRGRPPSVWQAIKPVGGADNIGGTPHVAPRPENARPAQTPISEKTNTIGVPAVIGSKTEKRTESAAFLAQSRGIVRPEFIEKSPRGEKAYVGISREDSPAKEPSKLRELINRSDASFLAETPEELESHAREVAAKAHSSSNFVYIMASLTLLALSLFFWNRSQGSDYQATDRELTMFWASGQPSKMQLVAEAAVDEDNPSSFAEALIVESAMKVSPQAEEFNDELVRIAFDRRWEKSLGIDDKKMVLTLAMSKLLNGKAPKNLKSIHSLHPGVILAIAATVGEAGSNFLKGIPVSRLTELPPPISPAFRVLSKDNFVKNCASEPVGILARLAARGVKTGFSYTEELHKFVEVNTGIRLKALAFLFSDQEVQASRVVKNLLSHPSLKPSAEVFTWGVTQQLLGSAWGNLPDTEKLLVLAGMTPTTALNQSQIESLFLHPDPNMRAAGITSSLEKFKWGHPGAVPVFKALLRKPDALSPIQTARLGAILSDPDKVPGNLVKDWLKGEPHQKIIEALLVSTYREKNSNKLDFYFSRYLNLKNWQPGIEQLRKLSLHPQRTVRLRAYQRIFELENSVIATALLEKAKEEEQDLEFIDIIDEKLSFLRSNS